MLADSFLFAANANILFYCDEFNRLSIFNLFFFFLQENTPIEEPQDNGKKISLIDVCQWYCFNAMN